MAEGENTGKGKRSNLYVIVLDAYARTDTLQRFFGCDNRGFLAELKGMDFTVAEASTANYVMSALSMASMFNLDYVQNLGLARPKTAFDLMPANEKLNHSRSRALLGSVGFIDLLRPLLSFLPLNAGRRISTWSTSSLSIICSPIT